MSQQALSIPPNETELKRWTISKSSFAKRSFVLFALTFAVLGFVIPPDRLWLWPSVSAGGALFYMWIFGDFKIWTANRKTLWVVTDAALYVHGPDEEDPVDLRIILPRIQKITRIAIWSLTVRFADAPSLTLPLVPQARRTRALILKARDGLMTTPGTEHTT